MKRRDFLKGWAALGLAAVVANVNGEPVDTVQDKEDTFFMGERNKAPKASGSYFSAGWTPTDLDRYYLLSVEEKLSVGEAWFE